MPLPLARLLPVPGPVWGAYPQRPDADRAPPRRAGWPARPLPACRRVAARAEAAARRPPPDLGAAAVAMRARLRAEGLTPAAVAEALGLAAAAAAATLGWTARPTQLMAAAALVDCRMAEMATGEGKTLAIGLAAAVGALAALPVHVVTANAYLAQRDAARLAPFFAALGLRVAAVPADPADAAARRAAYAHDVVYATAKGLAFDFLRDRLGAAPGGLRPVAARVAARAGGVAAGAEPPLLRGLCMALLDEADSILLDEAEVPLVLSRQAPHAARRAFLWQALALARGLSAGNDFMLHPADRQAELTSAGERRLAAAAAALGGPWLRPRYRREAVLTALAALHLYRRQLHYVVRDGEVQLLDEVTGRVAVGRLWSRGLQTLVALKEGLNPPADTETLAQTTFQRFFQRYWRLGGISGTLAEARAELREVYGSDVVALPLHRPSRRIDGPDRRFDDREALLEALVARTRALRAAGRAVLIGTDSVEDSREVAGRLAAAGVAAAVLNALQDAEEAAIVAAAGRAGQVTVATRMAGRGTDIELDAPARAAGGLHVIAWQDNPSRRQDRQLLGRAGRHGDPGSTECWFLSNLTTQAPHGSADIQGLWRILESLARRLGSPRGAHMRKQRREERRRALLRRQLLAQDLQWQRRLSFAGPGE
jgi:preprotein translocase subunit SecA